MSEMSRGLYQCPSCYGPSMGPGQCVKCLSDSKLYSELRHYMAQHSVGVEAAMKYLQARHQDVDEQVHMVPLSFVQDLCREVYGIELDLGAYDGNPMPTTTDKGDSHTT